MSPEEFGHLYPLVSQWIDQILQSHSHSAKIVAAAGFPRLPQYFSSSFLGRAKFISLLGPLPQLPLAELGVKDPKLIAFKNIIPRGITYPGTYFVLASDAHDEALHFHELIHVVQWEVLGRRDFCSHYADGLLRFGYRSSPLEVMAYDAENLFRAGKTFDAFAHVHDQLKKSVN